MIHEIKVKNIIIWVCVVLVLFAAFSMRDTFFNIEKRSTEGNSNIDYLLEDREQSTPGVLLGYLGGFSNNRIQITADQIVYYTNIERQRAGMPALIVNQDLSDSSGLKTQNMMDEQYFEHVNKEGKGLEYFISLGGYEYLTVGENLAMGNWSTAEEVVAAWMNSPGHRANILSDNFKEIGVSILYGEFEGNEVLMAVQHFGTDKDTCPPTSISLKTKIGADKAALTKMEAELDDLHKDIEAGDDSKIDEYNSLIEDYNGLSATIVANVDVYNDSVNAYNTCSESYYD